MADDLLAFMEQVASEYRAAKKIVVVWDNLNIHHDGRSQRWTEFNERRGGKFDFRFTPLHAPRLNQVEVFFSIVYGRCLKHESFVSVEDLRAKVLAFIRRWNEKDGHAFVWCFRGYPIQSKAKAVAPRACLKNPGGVTRLPERSTTTESAQKSPRCFMNAG